DGRPDVFIGARNVPKNYGVSPRSYLLENQGSGRWKDVTPDSLKHPGMITDATWTDYDNDGDDDLIVVGEWMPVIFFKNDSGKLHYDFTVKKSSGWWSTIAPKDLDGDGDIDFVLGNWGNNSRFQASEKRPLSMYVGDFNRDKKQEFLITSYLPAEGKAYPFHPYDDMIKQFPFLKEKIPDHHAYAKMTYKKLFSKDQRKRAKRKQVQTLSSSLLINENGTYELKKLPLEAQISPVHAIVAEDFNGDSRTDLLLLGNETGLKPNIGTLSGNWGVLLLNDRNLDYKFEPYSQTNTIIKGEVRDALTIRSADARYIIIGRNNEKLLMYKTSKTLQ
ncbi:MAG TPA: VCBS repeat-containing protein, partial [Balneolaceae bacterium]|nr:VCBS repeat-containing protein [Balneolaceae bacterium]